MHLFSRALTLSALVLSLFVSLARAQGTQSPSPSTVQAASDAPNLVHDRHTHPHGKPHPTTRDTGRFVTSRPDALQLPLPEEKDAFTFAIFGDRTGGPPEGVNVLADAVRDVNLVEPDFVITVGDLVQGYNEKPEWEIQAKEFSSIMNKLLCPWFPVAGNHDVYWRDKDKSGDKRPPEEHEKNYELHFGPLWYAFKHKNSWFIVLYTDEANPNTGERNFNKPENHEMSDEQFNWLADILGKAKSADHVFLFMHHPRWTGGIYGDSWNRVHDLLKANGNVTAVFGGHIHRMRADPKDGIEYFALSTTGGHNPLDIPDIGLVHNYTLVTVRKQQVAVATVPVGDVLDTREITQSVVEQVQSLRTQTPKVGGDLILQADGTAKGHVEVTLQNPTTRPVAVTAMLDTKDSRWSIEPDHDHATIKPGESRTFEFHVEREASPLDHTFRPLEFVYTQEYLAKGFRYEVPELRLSLPPSLHPDVLSANLKPKALQVRDVRDAVRVNSRFVDLAADSPLTVECWFKPDSEKSQPVRCAVISKAQGSDYGMFVSNGRPQFSVHVGGDYVTARAPALLTPGQWHHLAGVFDGKAVTLFIDGKPVARKEGGGERRTNDLPLVIGADVENEGRATDSVIGLVDAVRVSKVARYAKEFTPSRQAEADENSLLVLNFDFTLGDMLLDESPRSANPSRPQKDSIVPVDVTDSSSSTKVTPIQAVLASVAKVQETPAVSQKSLIVAHRGASADAPENTRASFTLAWQHGADAIEGDFHLTRDGHLVCMHDPTTKRTAGFDAKIVDLSLADLRKLDIGSWKSAAFASERPITLTEVLALVPRDPTKLFLIELKCGVEGVPEMRRSIEASGVPISQLRVISFKADVIAESKRTMPELKAFWLTSYKKDESTGNFRPTLDEVLATLKQCNADGLDSNGNLDVLTPDFVNAIRTAGYEFHVWTIDDAEIARKLIDLGAMSVTTNKPQELRAGLPTAATAK